MYIHTNYTCQQSLNTLQNMNQNITYVDYCTALKYIVRELPKLC